MKGYWAFAGLLTALLATTAATADQTDPLYRTTLRVTGDREETRVPAIPEGFERVAQKLTGNPDVASDTGFAQWAARSRGMVWSYTYHDRLFGRPIHDEQGTRDRPFDLTLQFDQQMLDAALAALGEKPWPQPRPKVVLLVAVKDMARSYVLAAGGAHGGDQRDSFADAAERFAMPIAFPGEAQLSDLGIGVPELEHLQQGQILGLKTSLKADAVLVGHLDWNAAELGWTGRWALADPAGTAAWSIHGVNFDAAFRDAVGGAAKRLRPSAR